MNPVDLIIIFIVLFRENRRKKRLEKEIKKFEAIGRTPKPIDEAETDKIVLKEAELVKYNFFFDFMIADVNLNINLTDNERERYRS
jgi:hypothetical protein